jgi:hypothetical protein
MTLGNERSAPEQEFTNSSGGNDDWYTRFDRIAAMAVMGPPPGIPWRDRLEGGFPFAFRFIRRASSFRYFDGQSGRFRLPLRTLLCCRPVTRITLAIPAA